MKPIKTTLILLLTFFSIQIQAQNETLNVAKKPSLDSGTIESQFEYITKSSMNWRDERGRNHEVIKIQSFKKLKSNTIDSLKAAQKTLNDTKIINTKLNDEITKLKMSLSSAQGTLELERTNAKKSSEMQISNIGFNTLMWSIIGVLFLLTLFFIYKFKKSNTITKEVKKSLQETEGKFEKHRHNALDREQKVRRKLQDEIMKHNNTKKLEAKSE